VPLRDRQPGEVVEVQEVEDEDPRVLRELEATGIRPGVRLQVVERTPRGVRIRWDSQEAWLDEHLAEAVHTQTAD
jgi:Fe2+ transport system protein FeoA